MSRNLLLIVLLFCCNLYGQNQRFVHNGGSVANDEILDGVISQNGNLYSVGYYTQSAYFDNHFLDFNGIDDGFLTCQDPNGNYLWVKSFYSEFGERAKRVGVDNQNNVYVAGKFSRSLNVLEQSIPTPTDTASSVFVAKYNPQGVLQYLKSFNSKNIDINGFSVLGSGEVWICGIFSVSLKINSQVILNGLSNAPAGQKNDIYLVKLNQSGNVVNSKVMGSLLNDAPVDIDTDINGNVYVAGYASQPFYIDGAQYSEYAGSNVFVSKHSANGSLLWYNRMGGDLVTVNDLDYGGSRLGITGTYGTSMSYIDAGSSTINGNYTNNVFAYILTNDGVYANSVNEGSDNPIKSCNIAVTGSNEYFLSGTFRCVHSLYSSETAPGLYNSVGFEDIYVSKYSSFGARQWNRHYGGPRTDQVSALRINTFGLPIVFGSAEEAFYIPKPANFYETPANNNLNSIYDLDIYPNSIDLFLQPETYCGYTPYLNYTSIVCDGGKDLLVFSAYDADRPYFDYYNRTGGGCVQDITPPTMFQSDTIRGCDAVRFKANRGTTFVGPLYQALWNDSIFGLERYFTESGMYKLNLTTADGCRAYLDSAYIEITETPDLQELTGPMVQEMSISNPWNCETVIIKQLGTTTEIYPPLLQLDINGIWTYPNGTNLSGDDTIQVTDGGPYIFSAYEKLPCADTVCTAVLNYVYGNFDYCNLDSLNLSIFYNNSFEDTLIVCPNEHLRFFSVNDTFGIQNGTIADVCSIISWSSQINNFKYTYSMTPNYNTYIANNSGIDTIRITIQDPSNIGSGLLTIEKVFYINVIPTPIIPSFPADTLFFCPGDTVSSFYTTQNPGEVPDGIYFNHDTTAQTFSVCRPGVLRMAGTLLDTIHQCNFDYNVRMFVRPKRVGNVHTDPENKIKCPVSAVQCYVEQAASDIQWFGPDGNLNNNQDTLYAIPIGDYYLSYKDADGCPFVTDEVTIQNKPVPTFEFNTTKLCINSSGSISFQSSEPIGITLQNQNEFIYQDDTTSVFYVVVTDTANSVFYLTTNVCEDFKIDTIEVPHYDNLAKIYWSNNDSIACNGTQLNVYGLAGFNTYTWNNVLYNNNSNAWVGNQNPFTLTVTDALGCVSSDTAMATFIALPAQPIDFDVAPVCPNDTVTLNIEEVGNINWYQHNSNFLISQNSTLTVMVTPSNHTFDLRTIDPVTACTSLATVIQVPFNPFPSASIQTPSYYCLNDTLSLEVGNVVGASNYFWMFNGNQITQNSSDVYLEPNVSANDAGNYFLNLEPAENYCPGIPQTLGIYIDSLPSIVLNPLPEICENAQFVTNIPTNPQYQANWTFPNNQNVNTPNLLFAQTNLNQEGIYKLLFTNNGCTYRDTFFLNVVPLASYQLIDSIGACFGDSVYFDVTNLQGIDTYSWTLPDNSTINNQAINFQNIDVVNQGNYVVNFTFNPEYCAVPSDSIPIIVTKIEHTLFNSPDTLCQSENLNISFPTNPTYNYQWQGPQGFTQTNPEINLTSIQPAQSGFYVLKSLLNNCVISDSIFIQVNHIPNANPELINSKICEEDTLFITNINSSAYEGSVLNWLNTVDFVSVSSDSIYLPNFNANSLNTFGAYYSLNNCYSDTTVVEIPIYDIPYFDFAEKNITICNGETYEAKPPFSAFSYLWSTGDTVSSIYLNNDTTVWLRLTSLEGCIWADTMSALFVDCNSNIPNVFSPNEDGINDVLSFTVDGGTDQIVFIYDRWGKLIRKISGENLVWDGKDMNNSIVLAGTYFYVHTAKFYSGKNLTNKGSISVLY
jgi:gliding motility-associated-like protein